MSTGFISSAKKYNFRIPIFCYFSFSQGKIELISIRSLPTQSLAERHP